MRKIELAVSSFALLCILAYTWNHTGQLLSTYVTPAIYGYIAAFGIESAVISLSMRIGTLRRDGVNTFFFLLTLIAVVVVSAIANMVQGYTVAYNNALTWQSIQMIDAIQAGSWFAANGLLSLVTMALSEVIGTNINKIVQLQASSVRDLTVDNTNSNNTILAHDKREPNQQRARRKVIQPVSTTVSVQDAVVTTTPYTLSNGAVQVQAILANNPTASKADIAKELGVSRPTVYRHINELAAHANGHSK